MENVSVGFISYQGQTDLEVQNYINKEKIIKKIEFSYDGGRLDIYINDDIHYSNYGAGNDFNVTIS